MASADFPIPSPLVAKPVVRNDRTEREISQGKFCFLLSAFAGFTCVRVRMTIGRLRPFPDYLTTPALYPIPVRRIRDYGISFLQILPRRGHPGLALGFRPSRPAEDFHLRETKHAWRTKRSLLRIPEQAPNGTKKTSGQLVSEVVQNLDQFFLGIQIDDIATKDEPLLGIGEEQVKILLA